MYMLHMVQHLKIAFISETLTHHANSSNCLFKLSYFRKRNKQKSVETVDIAFLYLYKFYMDLYFVFRLITRIKWDQIEKL